MDVKIVWKSIEVIRITKRIEGRKRIISIDEKGKKEKKKKKIMIISSVRTIYAVILAKRESSRESNFITQLGKN